METSTARAIHDPAADFYMDALKKLLETGIPFLVDLPVIGRLFGVTNRQETKRDLLILITPHIIDDGQSPDSGRP